MCGVFEHSKSVPCLSHDDTVSEESLKITTHHKFGLSEGDVDDLSSFLLEFASNDDLAGFKQALESSGKLDVVGNWYCRQTGSNRMAWEQRTPAMIASLYGSVNVLNYILNCYTTDGGDINRSCGSDGSTALHCAVAGGASRAVETVNLLLSFGADLNVLDSHGWRPSDVIAASPRYPRVKSSLETILKKATSANGSLTLMDPCRVPELEEPTSYETGDICLPVSIFENLDEFDGIVVESGSGEVDMASTGLLSSTCSSPEALSPAFSTPSPSSSPKSTDSNVAKALKDGVDKIREYPVDPSLPDIKNSIYTTDEFRMFSFKVRPCSRAYSHDWTECPFVHPGENARRRDPRRYHYSCVPCPDFRKGACRRGDACEYAHGVFECWLHPAQYRTRLCKDGTSCTRRVCFFAHTTEELRPLYVSTGSAVVSPRTTSLDMMLSPPLAPASPSPLPVLMMPPFSPSNPGQNGLSTPPMSPSSTCTNSLGGTWQQPNVPTLHLPGVGLHASRLRASLSARDLPLEDISELADFAEGQLMGDFTSISSPALSTHTRLNAVVAASSCGGSSKAGKYRNVGLSVSPTNLEELFASEMVLSPRNTVHESALLSQISAQLQSQKSTQVHSQLQNALQSQISSHLLPQGSAQTQFQIQQCAIDSQIQGHTVLQSPPQSSSNVASVNRVSSLGLDADRQNSSGVLQPPSQSSFSLGSLGHISSLGLDLDLQSDSGALLSPVAVAARATFAQRDKHSFSSRDLGAGLTWSDWGSPTGKPEWGVQKDDLCKFRKSASFGFKGSEDPDFSWVQTLVKGPLDTGSSSVACSAESSVNPNGSRNVVDHSVLGSWIEEMHLDQIVS
eukprot:c29239_g1_i1 orf=348-2891(+)